jgi:HNH endonuclease
MLSPQEVEAHPAYRLTRWLLAHGDELLPVGLVLMGLLFVVCLAGVWLQAGARWIAVFWVWREFLRGLRERRHRGGAGDHSAEYAAYMQSPEWRRRRATILRQHGRRCQECGARGPLDVHHVTYRDLGNERPWQLAALCPDCHRKAHGR